MFYFVFVLLFLLLVFFMFYLFCLTGRRYHFMEINPICFTSFLFCWSFYCWCFSCFVYFVWQDGGTILWRYHGINIKTLLKLVIHYRLQWLHILVRILLNNTIYNSIINLLYYNFKSCQRPSWSWSYIGWVYNYLCNQYLSPLTLWVRITLSRGFLNTIQPYVIKYFSDMTEILLKMALNTINQTNQVWPFFIMLLLTSYSVNSSGISKLNLLIFW